MNPVFISHQTGPETPPGFERMSIDNQILLDDPVAEIRVVGVLERLSHTETESVIGNWAAHLEPGGLLRVSVPDFQAVVDDYLAGTALNVDHELLGNHATEDDCFGSAYDWPRLAGLLRRAGLVSVGWWTEDAPDLPRRLNVQAVKPLPSLPRVRGVMSIPRFGSNDFWGCVVSTLSPMGITITTISGAFWEMCIERAARQALKDDPDCEYLLFMDYDSIFNAAHVVDLLTTVVRYPEVDALAPLQCHRYRTNTLLSLADENGETIHITDHAHMRAEISPANTAHFGLTLVKRSALEQLTNPPWFISQPNADGYWEDGKIDADIQFWVKFKAAGFKLFIANRVPIGHLESMIRWPNGQLQAQYQHPNDFKTHGPPKFVWR